MVYDARGATPEERRLPWEDIDVNSTALGLLVLERWSGLRITQRWLEDTPRPIHRYPAEPPGP